MVSFMDPNEAVEHVKDNCRLMIGGFGLVGSPETLIDALAEANVRDLVIIGNDLGAPNLGMGKVLLQGKIKKAIGSYFSFNKDAVRYYREGKLDIELIPQGSFAEAIRAAGMGLGAFYTPTGAGTIYAEIKETRAFNGIEYVLEEPLHADVAFIRAHKADRLGNLIYQKSGRNFNPLMAMAAKLTIVDVDEVVEVGELSPDEIITPFIYVNIIVPRKGVAKNG